MSYQINQVEWGVQEQLISQIRERVFVCELHMPKDAEFDERDLTALHFLAFHSNGEAIATARLCKDGLVGRIAVLPAHRSRGVYQKMLATIISQAQQTGLDSICINCILQEVERFKRQGFSPCGSVFMESGIARQTLQCPVKAVDSSPFTMLH